MDFTFLRLHEAPMVSLLSFWAKLGNNEWPDLYHPLLCHLIDVGVVARRLWDEVLAEPLKKRLADFFCLDQKACGNWLAFWVAAHDIGKACPGFQFRDNSKALECQLTKQGYSQCVGHPTHHAKVTVPVLTNWLTNRGLNEKIARRVAYAVGGHHGTFGTCDEAANILGTDAWRNAQRDLLDALARIFGVDRLPLPSGGQGEDQACLMVLAGLTTAADWIGSNPKWFRPTPNADKNYLRTTVKRTADALAELRWIGPRDKLLPCQEFAQTFSYLLDGREPRPLQLEVQKIVRELNGPALVLIEAPMGEGKTEAALYLADCWRRQGHDGAYVALPTMATSNGMFGRVKKFLENTIPHWAQLHLLHGQAILNEQYQDLLNHGQVYDQDDDKQPGAVIAGAWFAAQKKQAILAPFGVGTIDQALLSVLQTKHFFLRLFALAGKTVILDEVHAYDAYMTTLLELLLKWLSALGSPVVLLSATLPAERRLALLKAYAGDSASIKQTGDYPRIAVARPDSAAISVRNFPAAELNNKTIVLERVADDALVSLLQGAVAKGGCACVIRNTVGSAQETYVRLKKSLEGTDITLLLFHARFPFGRRSEIEKEVLRLFGPGSARPAKAVLVATQVVEQSLDLDFDLMATDIAPIDLILQRSGRLHRHLRDARPEGLTKPRLWLIKPGDKDGHPDFGPSEWICERYVLLKSWALLKDRDDLNLPQEIEPLIAAVYDERDESEPDLAKAKSAMEESRTAQQSKAQAVLAPPPNMNRHFWHHWSADLTEDDDPRAAESRRAATRDVRPTVHLVIAYVLNGRDYLDPAGTVPLVIAAPPTLEHAKQVLENAVAVSHPGGVAFYAKRDPPDGWQRSGLLRFHRVVRVSPEGTSSDGEFGLTVSSELGIRFSREVVDAE